MNAIDPITARSTTTIDRNTTTPRGAHNLWTTQSTTQPGGEDTSIHPLHTGNSHGSGTIDPQGHGVIVDESHPCGSRGRPPFMEPMRARAQTESWAERLPVAHEYPRWLLHANCRGLHPDLMYPPPGNTPATQRAIECCNGCPSRMSCLANARTTESGDPDHDTFGVRGGLTATQRIHIYSTIRVA